MLIEQINNKFIELNMIPVIKLQSQNVKTQARQYVSTNLSQQVNKLQNKNESIRKTIFLQTQRINRLEEIKNRKHNTFIKQLNSRNQQIQKNNLYLLKRLTSSERKITHSVISPRESSNPLKKKFLVQTEKQNLRIKNRIKTLASSINIKKLQQQYQQSIKIKSRISKLNKFQSMNESRRSSIKSERNKSFTSQIQKINDSILSKKGANQLSTPTPLRKLKINENKLFSKSISKTNQNESSKFNSKQKKSVSFYDKDSIRKNKVDDSERTNLLKLRKANLAFKAGRNIPKIQQQQDQIGYPYKFRDNKNGFFVTNVSGKKSHIQQSLRDHLQSIPI